MKDRKKWKPRRHSQNQPKNAGKLRKRGKRGGGEKEGVDSVAEEDGSIKLKVRRRSHVTGRGFGEEPVVHFLYNLCFDPR